MTSNNQKHIPFNAATPLPCIEEAIWRYHCSKGRLKNLFSSVAEEESGVGARVMNKEERVARS